MKELLLSAIDCTWSNEVRQIEMHNAEPLVSEHSPSGVEIATDKLKRYKSPGVIKF
jgi:hypothetical protein